MCGLIFITHTTAVIVLIQLLVHVIHHAQAILAVGFRRPVVKWLATLVKGKCEIACNMCKLWKIAKSNSKQVTRSILIFLVLSNQFEGICSYYKLVGLIKQSLHIHFWSWRIWMKKNAFIDRYKILTYRYIITVSTCMQQLTGSIIYIYSCLFYVSLRSSHKAKSVLVVKKI